MDRETITNIWKAYRQVTEKKKLDPVDKDELKGSHKDREDGDIDNDGDEDESDEYLHNRRKVISKSKKKDSEVEINPKSKVSSSGETNEETQIDELSKKTLGSYVKKAKDSYAGATGELARPERNTPQGKKERKKNIKTLVKRNRGIDRAVDKLTKEEIENAKAVLEGKMSDEAVLKAARALAANGKNEKTKSFGQGLVDFYKKNGSFTPDQVSGLQNIMKNASFQMAKEEVENLDELSNKKLAQYAAKASVDGERHFRQGSDYELNNKYGKQVKPGKQDPERLKKADKHYNKYWKRKDGVKKALSKIKNEQMEESMDPRRTNYPYSETSDDRLTASDRKFIDAHGVPLSGQPTDIDGKVAADFTAQSIKNSEPSVAPVRGDENTYREKVREAKTMAELMNILSEMTTIDDKDPKND